MADQMGFHKVDFLCKYILYFVGKNEAASVVPPSLSRGTIINCGRSSLAESWHLYRWVGMRQRRDPPDGGSLAESWHYNEWVRSFHSGLMLSISLIFFSLEPDLICFSLALASMMLLNSS